MGIVLAATRSAAQPNGLTEIQRAYGETIMSMPDYEQEYGTSQCERVPDID